MDKHLRVDTIAQAIVRSGVARHPVGPVGYVVGYALAGGHLRQELTVIAESVNPPGVTRDAWRRTAVEARLRVVEVEVVCSDRAEHRRRVTSRSTDTPGLPLQDWQQVISREREREPWIRERVVIDTAGQSPQQSLAPLHRGLASG
ncbi:AAA family ATPase [Streptomyces fagopyri]|uniref:AAA family ATPase n=1 Tax=Streptomyces fagopyri TaxID=2662397 RepID=UPI001D1764B8|nr:adenylyl-sulfate kinase [Streptomyces fagopyri]